MLFVTLVCSKQELKFCDLDKTASPVLPAAPAVIVIDITDAHAMSKVGIHVKYYI